MNFYLLDAGAPGLVFAVMIVFMLIVVLVEWVAMILMKYNKVGKAILDSFVINLVSMAAGFVILFTNSESLDLTDNLYINIALLFGITVVIEFGMLYLLNLKKPVKKTFLTALVINIITYLIYYLFQIF